MVLMCLGLGIALLPFLGILLHSRRKAKAREIAYLAMTEAKLRLQNKIQVLCSTEPTIHSSLSMNQIDLMNYLRRMGYVANLEKHSEKFLASCKAFKPHLIVAEAEFLPQVEAAMDTDALLINTPVIYLRCENPPDTHENRIRAYLKTNATDKELGDAIAQGLKKSPEKIRFSVKATALKGNIYDGTLEEIFHFLFSLKKTGHLLLGSGTLKGEAHFLHGNLAHAVMQDNNGEKAVFEMLNLASGTFEFHEKEIAADGKVELNTVKVLMDWARNRDESDHYSRP